MPVDLDRPIGLMHCPSCGKRMKVIQGFPVVREAKDDPPIAFEAIEWAGKCGQCGKAFIIQEFK